MGPSNRIASMSEGDDDEANMEIDLPEEDRIRPLDFHIDRSGEIETEDILEEFE